MSRHRNSPRHEALRAFIVDKRTKAGLRQVDVAKRVKRYQSYITHVETGQKEIGVVELVELAEAIGFDPIAAIKTVMKA